MNQYYSKRLVAELKRKAALLPIVRLDTDLSNRGEYCVGDSPFSPLDGEPEPIFVNPTLNRYKCEACGESGDVIAYVRRRHGLSFAQAVRWLAELVGYELEARAPSRRRAIPPPHPELRFDWGDAA